MDVGIPVWVVSLDLSKAFDRVHWPALWKGLLEQGISEHMIWMISKLYDGQFGEVIGSTGRSRKFNITGGVRQRCLLSPRLFCAVLQFAMRKWRMKVGDLGFDLSDGMPHLIDLRFADILLFARSAMEVRKHRKAGAGHGLSADCLYTIVLQNFCLHDTAQNTVMS